jgi:hypothetical protein
VHHEPCRFVHDQDVIVLEEDGDGDLFRREVPLGDARFHALSAADPVGRRGFAAIDEQEVLRDQALHEATADPEPPGCQLVDALPCLCRVYSEVPMWGSFARRDDESLLAPAQETAGPGDAAVRVLAFFPIEELL